MTTVSTNSELKTTALCFYTSADFSVATQLTCIDPQSDATYTNGHLVLSGVAGTGNVAISNVLDPLADQDAATKFYVDSIAGSGVSWEMWVDRCYTEITNKLSK